MALRRKKHAGRAVQADPTEASGFHPYVAAFLAQALSLGGSRDTHKRRQAALRRFVLWCMERGLEHPREITRPILARYQRHLHYYRKADGRPLTPSSQNVMLTPIKAFFRWLTRENHILSNPASELAIPRKRRALPRHILSLEEVERVFRQPDLATPEGRRDRAMLEVLYATGLRRLELARLQLADLDPHRGLVWVREGKGGQDRVVPISARALGWVQRYLDDTRPRLLAAADPGHVFLTDWGEPFKRGYLATQVKRHLRAAGIEAPGACHLFRHALATHLLENGADVRFIQALLGHRDLSTTEIYTRVSVTQLQSLYRAALPLGEDNDPMPAPEAD